jgi:hypothetical protein
VKWLPLRQAVETLSRPHEKIFLSHVGPAALKAAEQPPRALKPVEPAPPLMPPEPPSVLEQDAMPLEQEAMLTEQEAEQRELEVAPREEDAMPRVTVFNAIMGWLRRVAPRQFGAD